MNQTLMFSGVAGLCLDLLNSYRNRVQGDKGQPRRPQNPPVAVGAAGGHSRALCEILTDPSAQQRSQCIPHRLKNLAGSPCPQFLPIHSSLPRQFCPSERIKTAQVSRATHRFKKPHSGVSLSQARLRFVEELQGLVAAIITDIEMLHALSLRAARKDH